MWLVIIYVSDIMQLSLDNGDWKLFWRYIKSQKQDSIWIYPIEGEGRMYYKDLICRQILSLFTACFR